MKIAVLGCGSIGRRHLENLKQYQDIELVAYEPVASVALSVADKLNIPVYSTLEAVWEKAPAITVIAAPTALHVELALAAAKQNSHLLIEKPLAASPDNVQELIRQIDERNLITLVGCNMRFHPGPATVKRLLERQVIGEVIGARVFTGSFLPRWRPSQDYHTSYSASVESGGAILDCIHELDLALWYFGAARLLSAVHRPAHTIGLETDGLAEILLQHESGVISSVHLNFVQRNYYRGCDIVGSEGTIHWEWNEHRVTLFGPDGTVQEIFAEPERWQVNQMYIDEVDSFLYSVQAKTLTMNPVCNAARTLQLALEARGVGKQSK